MKFYRPRRRSLPVVTNQFNKIIFSKNSTSCTICVGSCPNSTDAVIVPIANAMEVPIEFEALLDEVVIIPNSKFYGCYVAKEDDMGFYIEVTMLGHKEENNSFYLKDIPTKHRLPLSEVFCLPSMVLPLNENNVIIQFDEETMIMNLNDGLHRTLPYYFENTKHSGTYITVLSKFNGEVTKYYNYTFHPSNYISENTLTMVELEFLTSEEWWGVIPFFNTRWVVIKGDTQSYAYDGRNHKPLNISTDDVDMEALVLCNLTRSSFIFTTKATFGPSYIYNNGIKQSWNNHSNVISVLHPLPSSFGINDRYSHIIDRMIVVNSEKQLCNVYFERTRRVVMHINQISYNKYYDGFLEYKDSFNHDKNAISLFYLRENAILILSFKDIAIEQIYRGRRPEELKFFFKRGDDLYFASLDDSKKKYCTSFLCTSKLAIFKQNLPLVRTCTGIYLANKCIFDFETNNFVHVFKYVTNQYDPTEFTVFVYVGDTCELVAIRFRYRGHHVTVEDEQRLLLHRDTVDAQDVMLYIPDEYMSHCRVAVAAIASLNSCCDSFSEELDFLEHGGTQICIFDWEEALPLRTVAFFRIRKFCSPNEIVSADCEIFAVEVEGESVNLNETSKRYTSPEIPSRDIFIDDYIPEHQKIIYYPETKSFSFNPDHQPEDLPTEINLPSFLENSRIIEPECVL
ncbi:hypothetical protein PCE1_004502 [Barthelona sp. PCE]